MKFINYTNDGRVVVQHAALILSKLDETDTLELHTMDNAIILLKKDMTLVETRDVLQGMVRLARSMTLDALCNSDAEDITSLLWVGQKAMIRRTVFWNRALRILSESS